MTDKEEMRDYAHNVAEKNNYYLCPDEELLENLIEGLAENKSRYGYPSCPCRPASGVKKYDSDIICPCDYSDADINECGTCYCGLYVSEDVKEDPSKLKSIPERRPEEIMKLAAKEPEEEIEEAKTLEESEVNVWRCTVCGYLCAREAPPPVCPICKAKAERFEEFKLG